MLKVRKILTLKSCTSFLLVMCIISTILLSGCAKSSTNTIETPSETAEDLNNVSDIGYESLFKRDNIVDINLDIDNDNLDSLFNGQTNNFFSTDISIDGDTIKNVGICTKGNMSYRTVSSSDSNRYSFAIDFEKYEDGKNYKGLNSLVLNNNSGDPSFLKEYISYEMLSEIGAITPLCTFARLSINGEYFGLYSLVESPYNGKCFVERNFGSSDDAQVYEAGIGSSFASENSLSNITLTNGNKDNNNNLQELYNAISNLDEENYKNIESIFDVDSFLKYVACNVAFGSYDSYLSSQAQNYYLIYINDKFYFIPWDYDKSFGGFEGDQGISCAIKIDNPILNTTMDKLPLLNLITYPEYKEKYESYLKQLVNYLDNIEDRITYLADLIRTDVENDPNKLFTTEDFEFELIYSDSQIDTSEIQLPTTSANDEKRGPGNMQGFGNGDPPSDITIPNHGSFNHQIVHDMSNNFGKDLHLNTSNVSLMTYAVKLRDNIKSQLS